MHDSARDMREVASPSRAVPTCWSGAGASEDSNCSATNTSKPSDQRINPVPPESPSQEREHSRHCAADDSEAEISHTTPLRRGVDESPRGCPEHGCEKRVAARRRWRKASAYAIRRGRWLKARTLTVRVANSYTLGTFVCLAVSALIYAAEGESLSSQVEERMAFARDLGGETFISFTAAAYVMELVRFRVGYGDVVIKTDAGRAACMIGALILIPATVTFAIRFNELLEFLFQLSLPKSGSWKETATQWREQMFIGLYVMLMAVLLIAWGLFIWAQQSEAITSQTDIVWFMWQSMTTVGYGDIDVATLSSNSFLFFALQYMFCVISACLTDGLLARCCIMALKRMR